MQCLNKWLWYDLIRSTGIYTTLCSNDARSCYDHIVHLIAALCMCCLGASKSMVFSMIDTLHGMNHHIQTIFGDSKCFANQTTWEKQIVGIGQENGAGSQIWVAVSSPLFTIMGIGWIFAQIVCAMSAYKRDIVGFAFVDDMDLWVLMEGSGSSPIATHLQAVLTNWEGLLKVTGGALVPNKCFWYLVDQTWINRNGNIKPKQHHQLNLLLWTKMGNQSQFLI